MKSIEQRIIRILLDDFKVPFGEVGPDTAFRDLSIDSLVIVELALLLRNEFRVTIRDGELTETMTVAEAAALLASKGAVAA